jgi:hypothetical protein
MLRKKTDLSNYPNLENLKRRIKVQELLTVKRNQEVKRVGFNDITIPELRGVDLEKVVVVVNGINQTILKTSSDSVYTIRWNGVTPPKRVDLHVYLLVEDNQVPVVAQEIPEPEPEPVVKDQVKLPKRSIVEKLTGGVFKKHQEKFKQLTEAKKDQIRSREALNSPGLQNIKVLTFDQPACWARLVGMLQKAIQLESQIKIPLHEYYDRITGQGYGAIIAAAIAAGIPLKDIATWMTIDWRRAHTPATVNQLKRMVLKALKPNESGFDCKVAEKALKKLFTASEALIRMRDVRTQLQVNVIQGDLLISTHDSNRHPDMSLLEVVIDTAITRMNYNSKETVKGEAVFLGSVEKNDVLGLASSLNNDGLQITSIGAPVRVHTGSVKELNKSGHAAMKVMKRDATHHVFDGRVEQVLSKYKKLGAKIDHLRLECAPIDHIVLNSTTYDALQAGVKSGSGKIDLPVWFLSSIKRQIA